jgi:hypothetical protein
MKIKMMFFKISTFFKTVINAITITVKTLFYLVIITFMLAVIVSKLPDFKNNQLNKFIQPVKEYNNQLIWKGRIWISYTLCKPILEDMLSTQSIMSQVIVSHKQEIDKLKIQIEKLETKNLKMRKAVADISNGKYTITGDKIPAEPNLWESIKTYHTEVWNFYFGPSKKQKEKKENINHESITPISEIPWCNKMYKNTVGIFG